MRGIANEEDISVPESFGHLGSDTDQLVVEHLHVEVGDARGTPNEVDQVLGPQRRDRTNIIAPWRREHPSPVLARWQRDTGRGSTETLQHVQTEPFGARDRAQVRAKENAQILADAFDTVRCDSEMPPRRATRTIGGNQKSRVHLGVLTGLAIHDRRVNTLFVLIQVDQFRTEPDVSFAIAARVLEEDGLEKILCEDGWRGGTDLGCLVWSRKP